MVADSWNNRIMRWPRGTSKGSVAVHTYRWRRDEAEQFTSLSFDLRVHLYVVDEENDCVQRFELLSAVVNE